MTLLVASDGPPDAAKGRLTLIARGVAARFWCAKPRREPRLTSDQGDPVKYVIIGKPWYDLPDAPAGAILRRIPAQSRLSSVGRASDL